MKQPANLIASDDGRRWHHWPGSGHGRLETECAMRATGVVLVGVLAQHVAQVALALDEQPVQTLAADGAHPALRDGARAG